MDDDLPIAVRTLLADCIDSVEQLEILVLLHRERDRRFAAAEVSQELRTNVDSTRERLDELVARGLAAAADVDGARRYALLQDREAAVAAVAEAYAARRVSVITFIVTKPVERIRSFADAFRLRRDPHG